MKVGEGAIPSLSLRRATAEDAACVRDLTREAYASWVPVIGREPLPMTADYEAAVRYHHIELLFVDGALAGLIEMVHGEDHLLIENVAVSPAFQKRGLGRALLAHAEGVAVRGGFAVIRLYTNKRFAENIALYQRLGYAVDREAESVVGIRVYMSKAVGAA